MRWIHAAGRGLLVLIVVLTGYVASGAQAGQGPGDGRGPLTLATAGDLTGYLGSVLDGWNRTHPGEEVTLVELPDSADETRAQMITDLRAGEGGRFDVLNIDVSWTSEFAAAGWIRPLPRDRFPLDTFLPRVVDTATYDDRLYAVPYVTNAGLLLYRKDVLADAGVPPPRTWAELERAAKTLAPARGLDGYAGQFLPYEGLTVNYLEAVQSAGGELLNADGTVANVDDRARKALDFLVDGVREGWIPQEALSYKEEEARQAFQQGRLLFARNWPYAYGPAKDSPVKGKFAVAPLPGADGPGTSTLGGYNLALNASSKRQKPALEFIRYFTGLDNQRLVLTEGSFAPVWARLYDDPELVEEFPYLPVLKETILRARPRPVSDNYNQISLVIADNVSDAMAFRRSPAETVTRLRQQLAQTIRTP